MPGVLGFAQRTTVAPRESPASDRDLEWGTMPTDLTAVFTRKREAEAQTQAHITMMLVYFVICLVAVALLFVDQSYAEAVELIGLY
jgi:hypothetical protein